MAKILDGRVVRDEILDNLKSKIENLKSKPKLVIIQVGDLDESNTYIGQKIKFGEKIGAIAELKKFPANISQESLTSEIRNLNTDSFVHGIIIQLPIPEHLDKDSLIELIDPKKDVDGLTSTNEKLLQEGKIDPSLFSHPGVATTTIGSKTKDSIASLQNDKIGKRYNDTALIPATAKGVITILKYYKVPIKGKKAAVVGRSKLVGAPIAILLKNLGTEVEVGHSQTPDLTAVTKPADIIVVAVGKPNLITKNHVAPGQTVIDVGINVLEEPQHRVGSLSTGSVPVQKRLVGDVNFEEVEPIVTAITPVPGGIGPMTVASLYENLMQAYKKQILDRPA